MDPNKLDENISILSAELKTQLSADKFSDFKMFESQNELDLAVYFLLEHLLEDTIVISRKAYEVLTELCIYCGGYFMTQEEYLELLNMVQHE